MRNQSARMLLLILILGGSIGCDQITKQIAIEHLQDRPGHSFLSDMVRIQYAENPGVFLGAGSSLPDHVRSNLITGVNILLLSIVAMVLLVKWDMDRVKFWSLALMLSGGIGNLLDRMLQNGLVTDFINLGIGPIRTGIFNVADVAISIGVILFLFVCWKEETARKHPPTLAQDYGTGSPTE